MILLESLLLALLAIGLIAAAVSDVRTFMIPNRLSAAIAIGAAPFILLQMIELGPFSLTLLPLLTHVSAGLVIFGLFTVLFALGIMGGGDVKLYGAVALWFGFPLVTDFVFISTLAGAALALAYWAKYRFLAGSPKTPPLPMTPSAGSVSPPRAQAAIPYGVAIAAGGLWVCGELIFNAWAGY